MSETAAAYYASGRTGWRAWWTLLHWPYTLMHLSFVVLGAALAPTLSWVALGWTVLAFGLALGVGAHALDELAGRPLGTNISRGALVTVAVLALAGASLIGLYGVIEQDMHLIAWIPIGVFFAAAYNLEWFRGAFHNDTTFALMWGTFPVLVAHFAQVGSIGVAGFLGGAYAFAVSRVQRVLSTEARGLRRRTTNVEGVISYGEGGDRRLTRDGLLVVPETALRWLVGTSLLVAGALLARHVTFWFGGA